MSDDNVIHLPVRLRPVTETPAAPTREHFGLRKNWLGSDNLREVSQKPLSAFAELARHYGDKSYKVEPSVANLFNPKNVDPTLRAALAAQISGVASQLQHLSEIAKSYGHLAEGIELSDLAGDAETISAHIEPMENIDV